MDTVGPRRKSQPLEIVFWRHKKVLRDRAAGLSFDWRRGHGSTSRLVFAIILVTAVFWVVLASVKIREPEGIALEDDQIDLTLIDLDDERNRGLAALIEKETLFQERWKVVEPARVDREVEKLLAATSPRIYQAKLQEMEMPVVMVPPQTLPGRGADVLPSPDQVESVVFATPPANWWIEVSAIAGPSGFEPLAFPFPWPDDPALMSEGDFWTVVATVDGSGRMVSIDAGWQKSKDPRTPQILEKIQELGLKKLSGNEGLALWRLEARLVNRPVSK
jgi:hypothetical protein